MKNESLTRRKLTEMIQAKKDSLKRDLFMVTAFRATKDGSLQVEVCQNRALGGSKLTALQLLNRADARFKGETTLLFDWMTLTPESYIEALGKQTDATLEGLKKIASTWEEGAPTGKDAIVFPQLDPVTKFYDSVNEVELTPVISVTEKTESELYTFFKDEDKVQDIIDRGNRAMRVSGEPDADFLVHPETGEKIYRFTRTEFKEHGAEDVIIAGKLTETDFKKRNPQGIATKSEPVEDIRSSILGQTGNL
jgi:hypothetical protein